MSFFRSSDTEPGLEQQLSNRLQSPPPKHQYLYGYRERHLVDKKNIKGAALISMRRGEIDLITNK